MRWNLSIYSSFLDQKYPLSKVEGDDWFSALKSELHVEGLNEIDPADHTYHISSDNSVKVTDRISKTTYFITPADAARPKKAFDPADEEATRGQKIFL